jgi:glycosyltransferase involved in cell wall biosynthesis
MTHHHTPSESQDLTRGRNEIAILQCTMNGAAYLREQLNSFERQTCAHWKLWVSDDGSSDDTRAILEEYKSRWHEGRLHVVSGPRRGFAANFLSLACNVDISANYYAYSDQDDIWAPNKLALALEWLASVPREVPALYCGRTEIVDASGMHLGFSESFRRAPSFKNALTQNIGGGNTMVFNDAARNLLVEAGADVGVIAHDWWTYQVVSGCGGAVFYDKTPLLQYRQHQSNLIGANHTFLAPFFSIRRLLRGQFKAWNKANIQALSRLRTHLPVENRQVLDAFSSAREGGLVRRIAGIFKSGVYRQTFAGNLGLLVATLLKRI